MESLKHRLHYLPFEKFFPSEVRFQNGNGNGGGGGGDLGGGDLGGGDLGGGDLGGGDLGGASYGSDFGGYSFGKEASGEAAYGSDFAGYDYGVDDNGDLGQSEVEASAVFDMDEGKAEPSAPALSTFGIGKTIAGIIDVIGATLSTVLGHGLPAIAIGAAEKGTQVVSGKSWGQITIDAFGNLFSSPTVSETQASTPSNPSQNFSLSELSGFPSAEGRGEYPLIPIGAISTPSYVPSNGTLVQKEISALSKYLSYPTDQNLTDILNQAQFAYSSDQAKEEAQKETQSAQLASMLPIMGIILIGALVAFRKGARA